MEPTVPDVLLGPWFTLLAVLMLVVAMLASLALASVEMKPVLLYEAICATFRSEDEETSSPPRTPRGQTSSPPRTPRGRSKEAGQRAASPADTGPPKKRSKPRRLRLSKLKYFFLAPRRSTSDSNDPYELHDSSWIDPDPPCPGQAVEVFELPDWRWVSPAVSQEANENTAAAER